jgi:hypothetical protein
MAVTLGQIVQFQPRDPSEPARAALVTNVHEDGTADLTIFNGYTLGTTDATKVDFSASAAYGKASPLGATPEAAEE